MVTDKRIDAYIKKAQPFAKPVLEHLREIVHKVCPTCEETIKWGMPTFMYHGKILCAIAAFKQHAIFGFWYPEQMSDPHGLFAEPTAAMGSFGKITTLADLPTDKIIRAYIKEAMELIDSGVKRIPKHPPIEKKELVVPHDLTNELKRNAAARKTFDAFSPSNKREYVDWLVEAKTDATRAKRLATAIEWMSEGKIRNWKYVRK